MTTDLSDVEALHSKFFDALNQMFTGDVSLMHAIWSRGDDAVYMGADGGYHVGYDAIMKNWEDQAALKVGGKISATDVLCGNNGDIGYAYCIGQGENTNAGEDTPVTVNLRGTHIFRKESGEWKILSFQTDRLPFLHTSD